VTKLSRPPGEHQHQRHPHPYLVYPDELPVSQARAGILDALRRHQVVVLAGETGSGKTTQLPKMLLELGYGRRGWIGHTQPRRIAARSVAERLADEMRTEVGGQVGYAVRFTDQVGADSMVKLMTDGILVAEIRRDPRLRRYDAIIVDEAHERSLTVDFLLGYLRELLPRRPDLKVVICSATIDPDRFARHFGGAPVLEVSGRTYPVEVRYRPVAQTEVDPDAGASADTDDQPAGAVTDRDPVLALCEAVDEVCAEGAGDVLVFLSGEREIRDTADALAEHWADRSAARRGGPEVEIVPLYGRLSAAEQHRVFAAHRGRRVVLATNVAETSLTVPGIRYVVDAGTARISRYSQRLKVQRLPIEPVSQASAGQRAGRCGRTADGICVRLYSRADYESRPRFTDPEILRTNLASVMLAMAALNLGELGRFPFVEPPDKRNIAAGAQLLDELGARSSIVGMDEQDLSALHPSDVLPVTVGLENIRIPSEALPDDEAIDIRWVAPGALDEVVWPAVEGVRTSPAPQTDSLHGAIDALMSLEVIGLETVALDESASEIAVQGSVDTAPLPILATGEDWTRSVAQAIGLLGLILFVAGWIGRHRRLATERRFAAQRATRVVVRAEL